MFITTFMKLIIRFLAVNASTFLFFYPACVLAEKAETCQKALEEVSSTETARSRDAKQLEKDALAFAEEHHNGEVRKFTKTPYIQHPIRVAQIVKSLSDDPELVAVAYLHDTIENTKATRESIELRFSTQVAEMVAAISSDKAKIKAIGGKDKYLADKMTKMSLKELLVKLADRLDNTSDFENAEISFITKYRAETNFILAIVGQRTDLLYPHRFLIERIYEEMFNGERVFEGRAFAEEKYDELKRKFSFDDYSVHPSRVSQLLNKREVSIDVRIAAYLKDILEKGNGSSYAEIKDNFGEKVADLVIELTVDPVLRDKFESRQDYERKRALEISEDALLIKLASRYDNLREIWSRDRQVIFSEYIEDTRGIVDVLLKSDRNFSVDHEFFIQKIQNLFYQKKD